MNNNITIFSFHLQVVEKQLVTKQLSMNACLSKLLLRDYRAYYLLHNVCFSLSYCCIASIHESTTR